MAQPKHKQIYDDIRRAVTSGEYKPGQQIPTEAALVMRYSTSRPTVARALLELQREGLIDRRAGSGTYVRQAPADQGLLFGLIIPRLGETEIFDPICREMARSAQAANHAILWAASADAYGNVAEETWQACQQCISRKVSGVFFAPVELVPESTAMNEKILEALDAARIPAVLLDRDVLPYPHRSRYDRVGIDNRQAGYMAADHLLKLGCREIGFMSKPHSAETVASRIAGYREALLHNGVVPKSDWVVEGDPSDLEFVARSLKTARAESFVCGNDITAANLMHSLDVLGVRTPDDIRIVGIDDVKYASLLRVPLTTLHQPCQYIGAAAVKAMAERIENPSMPPRDILFQAELVVRQSCGAKQKQPPIRPATEASELVLNRFV